MSKPNILFILSDQHHAGVAGHAGDPYVRTPNLDRMAAEGAVLENCYCASPLCVPSRMAMLSTLLPSATGVYSNFHALPSSQPTFVHSLGSAGYETALCGRMHFVGTDQRHGYENRLVGDITSPHVGYSGQDYGPLAGTTGQHRYAVERSGPGRSAVIAFDEAVTAGAVDFLAGRQDARPFFLTVGFYGPHCPFVAPRKLFDHYMDLLPLPEEPADFMDRVHPAIPMWLAARGLADGEGSGPEASGKGASRNPKAPPRYVDSAAALAPARDKADPLSNDAIRRARAAYYGLVELCDGYVGTILSALERSGAMENTLVIYASDHGEMMGDKRMWWKSSFYDGSARVPVMARWPGKVAAGHRVSAPTSLLDLGPTLIELAGGPAMPRTHGKSLLAELGGVQDRDPDRAVISLLNDIRMPMASAMVRWRQWKLIRYHGFEQVQLFNVAEDPRELNDLGMDPKYESIRAQMLDELKEHWDADAAAKILEAMTADAAFLKEWGRAVPQPVFDQWICRPEDNYLE